MMRSTTDAERDTYRRDGVVMLRRLFDASWLEDLRAYTDEVMRHPGAMGHDLGGPDDPGRFFSETFLWHRHPGFRRAYRHPRNRYQCSHYPLSRRSLMSLHPKHHRLMNFHPTNFRLARPRPTS